MSRFSRRRLALLGPAAILASSVGRAQTWTNPTVSDEDRRIFKNYSRWAWYNSGAAPDASTRYRAKLSADGLPASEIERQMRVVESDFRQIWKLDVGWEIAYESPANARFRTTPSPWLAQAVAGVKPGRALDLGMRQGRNGLFLAKQGWDVTGIDFSGAAISHARMDAKKAGVHYNTIVASIEEWDMGTEQWDLIVACLEPDLSWSGRIVRALRTGGLFVREGYGPGRIRGSVDKGENEVIKAFLALRVLRYEDKIDDPHYDPVGLPVVPFRMLRLMAQKIAEAKP